MNDHHRTDRLGTEPLGSLILRFSLPVIVNLLVNALYNLVDRVFVGRGVGQTALAGITVAFPAFIMVSAIGMLFGHGAATVISLSLGRRDHLRADQAVTAALVSSAIVAALTIIAGYVFLRPMLVAFGGSGEPLNQAERFMTIALLGGFFQVIAMTLAMVIRSAGDPATAFGIALIGTGVNLVLNPLFIFVLKMGIAGSALATTLAELASCAFSLAYFRSTRSLLVLRVTWRLDLNVLRELIAFGAGPFFMQSALMLVMAVSNNIVSYHEGQNGIAVMGIIYVIYPLILLPLNGLAAGVQPILGYNTGAGAIDRVRKALGIALGAGTVFCVVTWVPILLFPERLLRLFVGDTASVLDIGPPAIRTFFALLPLVGIQIVGANYFQAIGKASVSLLNNLLRQVVIGFPLLLVLPHYFGLKGFWLASPISDAAAFAVTAVFLLVELRRLRVVERLHSTALTSAPPNAPLRVRCVE